MISKEAKISLRRQSQILQVNRSNMYYKKAEKTPEKEFIKQKVQEVYEEYPVYGYRRITACIRRMG